MNTIIDNGSGGPTLILAHGAGSPMDSPFMNTIATGLADRGLRVVRFEFPYMADRRIGGKKRPPNPAAVLEQTWREVFEAHRSETTFIGGKSMGGRIASMLADDLGADGLVCLGYPFHPPYKPEKLRVEHLSELRTHALIVQGTRDQFGGPDEVATYDLSDAIEVVWVETGDHSFKPTVASGTTEAEALEFAIDAVATFIGR